MTRLFRYLRGPLEQPRTCDEVIALVSSQECLIKAIGDLEDEDLAILLRGLRSAAQTTIKKLILSLAEAEAIQRWIEEQPYSHASPE